MNYRIKSFPPQLCANSKKIIRKNAFLTKIYYTMESSELNDAEDVEDAASPLLKGNGKLFCRMSLKYKLALL